MTAHHGPCCYDMMSAGMFLYNGPGGNKDGEEIVGLTMILDVDI